MRLLHGRYRGLFVCWGRVVAKAGDRLWQLMMWQEQIKRWVCLWEARSSKLEAVTDSLCLWQTVCFWTDSMCLWQTVCVCERQSVSVTECLCPSYTVCFFHGQSLFVTDRLCLSQTVCVFHRLSVPVTDNFLLSQTVCVCHRQYVYITDSLCLSQTDCVCNRQPLSVTGSLCLSQTLFLIVSCLILAYLYVIFINICPWDFNLSRI